MSFRPSPISSTDRAKHTEDLIANKGSDVERWSQGENLATQWDTRAEIAGRLIGGEAKSVLDVGAGAMTLKSFLPKTCVYSPADIVSRCDGCFVVDLNAQQFPPGSYDVVTFLGVLEYIHDPAWPLLQAAKAAPVLIVSYCTAVDGSEAYRRGMGWVNDLSKAEFEALVDQTGWQLTACVEYKRKATNVQYVWKAVRKGAG